MLILFSIFRPYFLRRTFEPPKFSCMAPIYRGPSKVTASENARAAVEVLYSKSNSIEVQQAGDTTGDTTINSKGTSELLTSMKNRHKQVFRMYMRETRRKLLCENDDEVEIISSSSSSSSSDENNINIIRVPTTKRWKKLLQFHENYRPAWYGREERTSAFIRGGDTFLVDVWDLIWEQWIFLYKTLHFEFIIV